MDNQEKEQIQSAERQEKAEESMFDIAFNFEGTAYKGWGKPSGKKAGDDTAASYHIVLNGVFFGNLSFDGDQWNSDTQREHNLVQKTGEQIPYNK